MMKELITNTKLDFLSGGGKMGELIRSKDWSLTALGSPDTWPQSLRTAVSICIASNFPIAIAWGPHRVQIYNDGYWPITGDMHPASMGQDFKECWRSAWPVIGQAFEEAALGETRFLETQRIFLDRYGYLEETFFTFSFSPILDESGGVGGLFHPVIELTQQTLAERRLNILHAVANYAVNARTTDEASALILNCLKAFELDIPFVLLYSIAANGKEAKLEGCGGVERNSPLAPEKINREENAQSWPFHKVNQNGKAVQVDALADIFGAFACGPYPEPPKQALLFPVIPIGAAPINYFLVAGVSSRRSLDEKYRLFYELLAGSVTNVLTKARAYEEERKKADALAEIDKAKTVFFSNISHEFRTPLTLMLSPLEELLNHKKSHFSESEKNNIETTHRNAVRLLKLVNTLLDFSRIESGRHHGVFSLVDIVTLTQNLASNFRSVIEKADLKFIVKADTLIEPVYVDRQMWEKIVFNLLSNAFKYTLEGSITVEVTTENDFAVLKIKDTGVGIPENELPKMFERFHRVENVAGRTYEGTGIGLSLIKELVQMHHGTIGVESTPNEGSVFTVKIPFGKDHLDGHLVSKSEINSDTISSNIYVEEIETLLESQTKESIKTSFEKENSILATILVVDDNADMRKHISSILSNNFNVITAKNGLDALHKMKETTPVLVLSDIMMPVMDGIGLLKEIKSNKATENIPVIFLTARAGEESKIEGWETGADDYLVKPFSAKELIARVSSNIKTAVIRSSAEKHLYSLLMQTPIAIAIYRGPDFVVELVNDRMVEFYGKPREEIINRPIFKVFPEVAAHGVEALHRKVYETGERVIANEQKHEYYKNGKLYNGYFNTVFEPLRNLDNNIIGLIVTGHEVTEEVTARKKIEESEKQQAFLLRLSDALRSLSSPVDIEEAVTKIAMDFMDADRCHYSTIDGDNLIILRDALRGDLPSLVGVYPLSSFALFKTIFDAGRPFIVDDVHTSEIIDEESKQLCLQLKNISFINVPVIKNGKPVGLLSLVQSKARKWTDFEVQLTIETAERTWSAVERTKAEEALRKSEERYRSLFDSIDEGFSIVEVMFDEKGKVFDYLFLEMNPAHEAMSGIPRSAAGQRIRELMPNIEESVLERLEEVVLTGEPVRFEQNVSSLNRWFDVHLSRVGGIGSQRVASIFNNITERKQAEEKIKESESRFRTMADASPVLIWTIDANGLSSYYNKTFLDFIGVLKNEDVSNWANIVHPDDVLSTFDTINTAIAARASYSLECRLLRADGHWRWVLAQGNPRLGANNEFLGFVGSSVDITERQQAEEKVKESEKRFEAAILAVEGIIWTNNANGEMVGEQPGWANLTGQRFEEYQGYGWAEAVHPDDAQPTMEAWKNAVANKSTFEFEHRVNTRQNGWRFFSIKAVPALAENGAIQQWVGVHTDVTEQREAVQKLKESEVRFKSLADESPMFVFLVDPDPLATVSYWNKTWLNYTGQTAEQAAGRAWDGIIHPEDVPLVMDFYVSAFTAKHPYFIPAVRTKRHDGEYRWHTYKANPRYLLNGEFNGYIGVGFDIHEQKIAEGKIKESEYRFHNLIFSSPSAIGILQGEDLVITIANEPIIAIWGKGKEIIGKKYFEALPELAEQGYKEVFAKVYKTGTPFTAIETPVSILQNGETTLKYYNFIVYPQRNVNNEVNGIGIIATEVTSQAIFNNKIKESEERFRSLAQTLPQLVWVTDAQGNAEFASVGWKKYSGTEPAGEKEWKAIVHPDDYGNINAAWIHSLTTGDIYIAKVRLKNKDGQYKWHAVRGEPVLDEENKIVKWVGAFTDIHEQKTFSEQLEEKVNERTIQLNEVNENLEERNTELQKLNKELEAFTYISSHDLQEPLRKIQTFAGRIIATEKEQLSETAKNYFSRMQDSATRMQRLIQDLLAFSRVSTSERKFEKTDLTKIIGEVKSEFKEALEEQNATILASELCEANIIPFQFRQLMHNLIGNALKFSKQDIPARIIIKSELIKGSHSPFAPQGACHISVTDNGIGFEKHFSEKIFGVFQKLHSQSEYAGTGIGLAIVKKIVDNHNGIITAESELGKGARFNIYLPH